MKKAFTLAETLIVLFIIGILSTILIQSYLMMSDISLRVEQEQSITQEVLFASEVLQNFADRNSLDYSQYDSKDLMQNQGISDVLYLSGIDGSVTIYSAWSKCIDPWIPYMMQDHIDLSTKPIQPITCRLEANHNGKIIELTNKKKVYMSKAIFKIIPYATTDSYFAENWTALCPADSANFVSCLHHPGVWLIQHAYSVNHGLKWSSKSQIPIQQFFNLQ